MNPELAALLVVQQDDDAIRAIEARRDALSPRVAAMDKAMERASAEVARQQASLAKETERQRALAARIAEHRDRLEKTLAVLDQAHKVKEATAAMSQVETARRVVAEDESEMLALSRRVTDLRAAGGAAQEALSRRAHSAAAVGASLLSKYDRVQQRRRAAALFALNAGFSCGNCDTAIPLQRRPAMSSGQSIEVCEGCGVLLYLPTPPSAPGT